MLFHQQHVLAGMCEKRNPYALLVGLQTSTTSLEKNLEVSEKSKHRSAI
jgi:hypothetical protein